MINYPISIPSAATTRESSITLLAATVVGVNQSPYSYDAQVYDYNAEAWGLKVSINPLTRSEAQPWVAFLAALRGRRGTFIFGPMIMSQPLGSGLGIPVVSAAGQIGRELSSSGWLPYEDVLNAGDMFEIDQRLYMCLRNVISDENGNAVIDVFPRLKAHAQGVPLVLQNPVGTFRLTSNLVPVLDVSENGLFNINFEAESVE